MFRRLFHSTLLLALVLGFTGCDEAELTRPDAELIIGAWIASDAGLRTVVPGVTVSVFDALRADDQIAFDFEADGRFAFVFDVDDSTAVEVGGVMLPLGDVNLMGTYTVDEGAERLRLTFDGVPAPASVEYDFTSENAFDLIVEDPEIIALLLGVASDDLQLLASVVTGAEFSFRRQ